MWFLVAALIHWGAFGNYRLGDCTEVAAANIIQAHHPKAIITTNEVVDRWRETQENIPEVLNNLETQGFGGYTIQSYTLISNSQRALINATQSGAAYVVLTNFPEKGENHAVAVVRANHLGVWFISWGYEIHVDWHTWDGYNTTSYAINY